MRRALACALVCAASPAIADATAPSPARAIPWQERFDLDGDGVRDRIEVGFSGGAHCCYSLAVDLSSRGRRVPLRYEIEGGYVYGLDLSRPDHFDVRREERGAVIAFEDVWGRRIEARFPRGRLRITGRRSGRAGSPRSR